jgi:hypothetical protein
MNGTIRNQLGHIKCAVELLQQVLGVDAKEVFRFAYTHLYAPAQACGHARERVCARDINNNINILTKCVEVKRESMRGGEGFAAGAATHTQFLSFGFVLRNKPSRVPDNYALWWTKYMKDRDYVTSDGKVLTARTWRKCLVTFYNCAKVNEITEAQEWYEKWKGYFRRQEEVPRGVWEEKCRGCDNYHEGHCLRWMVTVPQSAAECKRFMPLIE